ncbi:hypothetical protein BJ741DRAFT_706279 [Chytriomyces cf. hyalinus JEL632]|nr:hypothetical protein BJ741DRAFT_706279 [Chytriomyces cf. hyalinus JEL632]
MFRSALALFPRAPRFSGPTITRHSAPTPEMLARTQPEKSTASVETPISKPTTATKAPFAKPIKFTKKTKFHLTTTQTAVPLPTTFASKDMTIPLFKSLHKLDRTGKPAVQPAPIAGEAYPFRYYKITLRRGLRGIEKSVKKCVDALGLKGRHETVWKSVNPHNAGLILKIRELITVELANELPQDLGRPRAVKGYVKAGCGLPIISA